MRQTSVALPALLAVEYALAQLWMSWGIRPQAMIGHSLGEYTAACLAGVFSLEDALALVVLRGGLFEQLPGGGMLSIPLPEREVRALIDQRLAVAAINGPSQCVVSGPVEAIERLAQALTEQDIEFRRLQIDVAAHSPMVAPILDEFGRFIATRRLHSPQIPFVSNVTGAWITAEEATDPAYWVNHLQRTVRFADGLHELLDDPGHILLEVGPGQTLTTLARLQSDAVGATIIPSLGHVYERLSDNTFVIAALGKLWMAGATIDWPGVYAGERRRRVPLPTYPFERQRYWVEPRKSSHLDRPHSGGKTARIADWFYLPSWKRAPLLTQSDTAAQGAVLICLDSCGIGQELATRLARAGRRVVCVAAGKQFTEGDGSYTINPRSPADYRALVQALYGSDLSLGQVIHLWTVTPPAQEAPVEHPFTDLQDYGLYSLLYLTQALAEQQTDPLQLAIISNDLQQVESADRICPAKATILAACKIIPQEHDQINCRSIDIGLPQANHAKGRLVDQISAEVAAFPRHEPVIAYRGAHRWVQIFEPASLEGDQPPLRPQGVYLITGGLGSIGLMLAAYLAETVQAKLVLVGRSAFPDRADWDDRLETPDQQDRVSRVVRTLRRLEAQGAEVLVVRGDVADEAEMRGAVEQAIGRFGALHGVIHAAGVAGEQAIGFITETGPDACAEQFHAKVHGTRTLARVLRDYAIDFCLLFSSNTSVLGGLGSVAYAAANLFMDSFAVAQNLHAGGSRWVSANWDGWLSHEAGTLSTSFQTSLDKYAMTPQESLEAFSRVLGAPLAGQIIVSTGDLAERLALWIYRDGAGALAGAQGQQPAAPGHVSTGDLAERLALWIYRDGAGALAGAQGQQPAAPGHARPDLKTIYEAPQGQLEQLIAGVWQELLGITQIGVEDNFFDLGGNSMVGLKVIARLKKALGVDIPIVSLFEGPTIRSFAALLSAGPDVETVYEASEFARRTAQTAQTARRSAITERGYANCFNEFWLDGRYSPYAGPGG